MTCPICEGEDIESLDETLVYQCRACGCAFGSDNEIIEKWVYCIECGDYVAPEDKPRHGEPVCQRCTG